MYALTLRPRRPTGYFSVDWMPVSAHAKGVLNTPVFSLEHSKGPTAHILELRAGDSSSAPDSLHRGHVDELGIDDGEAGTNARFRESSI